MNRPIFYVLSLFFHATFWLVLLLSKYATYSGNAPEVLQQDYAEMFEANRLSLILAELFFPVLMMVASVVLIIVKFRPAPIRLPYLLMLFMGLEFWVWRSFFFQDRMGSYYEMSEMKMNPADQQEGHFLVLIGYAMFFGLMYLVKEYREQDLALDIDGDEMEFKRRRPVPPWLRDPQEEE